MGTVNLGQAAIVSKGAYSAAASYVPLNLVTHNGGSYLCKRTCSNIEPGVASTWTTYWVAATVGIKSFAKTGETAAGMEYTATLSDGSTYVFTVKTAVNYPTTVANGGTGATTAAAARSNLGITPANIGAIATTEGAVGTSNLGDSVVTWEKLANSARGNASEDLSSTPFAAENNGRLLIFASDSDVSYTLTQTLWSSLPAGFSVTIIKANASTFGTLTINWESMAGVYDFTQGTVKYNNTGSVELVRRGDMVTFEKWGSTSRLLISGNFNTPNFYKGTSATPPSTWQPGDVYLQYT